MTEPERSNGFSNCGAAADIQGGAAGSMERLRGLCEPDRLSLKADIKVPNVAWELTKNRRHSHALAGGANKVLGLTSGHRRTAPGRLHQRRVGPRR